MDFIWKALALISLGTIFLRIAGRKSISQMTIAQTVIMISIGSLIIEPITERNIWKTIAVAATFILFILIVEFLQLKSNTFETFITGKSKTVIENGQLVPKNIKKMRYTVDQLEMRLRQQGISKVSDVKTATIEPNGQLGYELKREAKPLTVGEFEEMMGYLIKKQNQSQRDTISIFDEVRQSGHSKATPKNLQ